MIRTIIQAPDDRLRTVAVDPLLGMQSEQLGQLIEDLRDTFRATRNCIGLAATQIGYPFRVVIVDVTPARRESYLMIDPVIEKASDDLQLVNDGCMSIDSGQRRGYTKRPKRIVVRWIDETLQTRRQKFTGLIAACIDHEIDHLNGVLFTDKAKGTA